MYPHFIFWFSSFCGNSALGCYIENSDVEDGSLTGREFTRRFSFFDGHDLFERLELRVPLQRFVDRGVEAFFKRHAFGTQLAELGRRLANEAHTPSLVLNR